MEEKRFEQLVLFPDNAWLSIVDIDSRSIDDEYMLPEKEETGTLSKYEKNSLCAVLCRTRYRL